MSNVRGLNDLKKEPPGGGKGGMPPGFPGFPGMPGGMPGGPGRGGHEKQGKVKMLHKEDELQSELNKAGSTLVVVDFSASWCGPCHMIAPHYAELSEKYTNVLFLKIDVDECPKTADKCGVSAMPTFQFYKHSKKLGEFAGADPNQLKSFLDKYSSGSSGPSTGSDSGSGFFGGSGQTLGGPSKPSSNPQPHPQPHHQAEPSHIPATGGHTLGSQPSQTTQPARPPASNSEADEVLLSSMVEMGFPREQSMAALVATKNVSLDAAVEWCISHPESTPSTPSTTVTTSTTTDSHASTDQPKPMDVDQPIQPKKKTLHNAVCNMCMEQILGTRHKCNQCEDFDLCSICVKDHDHNPEHTFTGYEDDLVLPEKERKPLTKEEAEEQAKKLREKVKKMREERERDEAQEQLNREKARREGGKAMTQVIKDREEMQRNKELLQRKKEKEDEKRAKDAIKAQIEQDRREREARRSHHGATGEAVPVAQTTFTTTTSAPKEYTEALIQVRLPDGNTIKATFKPTDPIRTVFQHISLLLNTSHFTLSTTFPRKVYNPKETVMDTTTLAQAELVPTGTFLVTKL